MRNQLGSKQWTIAAALLLVAVLSVTPLIDRRANATYASLFQRALVTFALARTLNGVISAVQGTELALQPAGVGVTLTPGEILDPVNDLVERFSWVMLGATISLGIQQVLLDVSAWWVLQGLVAVLAIWLMLMHFGSMGENGMRKRILTRALLIALFLRFAVPLTLIANDVLYDLFLESRYIESTEIISSAGRDLEGIGQSEPEPQPEEKEGFFGSGILGSVGKAWQNTAASLDLMEKVDRIQAKATDLIEHLIQLSVVFILQTGILPIVFLWLFLQLGKWLFRPFKP